MKCRSGSLVILICISVVLNELFYTALINKAGGEFLEIKKLNL